MGGQTFSCDFAGKFLLSWSAKIEGIALFSIVSELWQTAVQENSVIVKGVISDFLPQVLRCSLDTACVCKHRIVTTNETTCRTLLDAG